MAKRRHKNQGQRSGGAFLYGVHPVIEAVKAGRRRIDTVHAVHADLAEQCRTVAGGRPLTIVHASSDELERLAGTSQHQGLIARVGHYPYVQVDQLLREQEGLLIVVDRVQDPRNLGAIIRTAAGVGAHGVIIPKDQSAAVTPTVVKASAGSAEWLSVAQVTNLVSTIKFLKDKGYWITGLDGQTSLEIFDADLTGARALVLGGEGTGLRRLVAETCDQVVKVPMQGLLESYNVSVAAAMTLTEIMRQRRSSISQ